MTLREFGCTLIEPIVARPLGWRACDLVELDCDLRGSQQSVAPQVERRRSCVRVLANSHNVEPAQSECPSHDADYHACVLENRP